MNTTPDNLNILENELFNVGIDCGRDVYYLGITSDQFIQEEWDYDWHNDMRFDSFLDYYNTFTLWASGVRVSFDILQAFENDN